MSEQQMTKETAIMELMIVSQQYEAVTIAIRALGDWIELDDLKRKMRTRKRELAKRMDELTRILNGGEFDIDKA